MTMWHFNAFEISGTWASFNCSHSHWTLAVFSCIFKNGDRAHTKRTHNRHKELFDWWRWHMKLMRSRILTFSIVCWFQKLHRPERSISIGSSEDDYLKQTKRKKNNNVNNNNVKLHKSSISRRMRAIYHFARTRDNNAQLRKTKIAGHCTRSVSTGLSQLQVAPQKNAFYLFLKRAYNDSVRLLRIFRVSVWLFSLCTLCVIQLSR